MDPNDSLRNRSRERQNYQIMAQLRAGGSIAICRGSSYLLMQLVPNTVCAADMQLLITQLGRSQCAE